jgi:hypothetical protein
LECLELIIRNSTNEAKRIFVAIPSYQRQHKETDNKLKINLPKLNTISKEKDENIELKAQKLIQHQEQKTKTYYSIL